MNTPDVRTLQLEHRWKVILDVHVFPDCAACRCWFPLLSFHFFYFCLFITAAPGLILWYQQHYLIFIFFKLFCHFSKFVCILKPAISSKGNAIFAIQTDGSYVSGEIKFQTKSNWIFVAPPKSIWLAIRTSCSCEIVLLWNTSICRSKVTHSSCFSKLQWHSINFNMRMYYL